MKIHKHATNQETSRVAALEAAALIREAVADHGKARIVVSTGNSQLHFIEALTSLPDVPWPQVEAFHLDEYVGMSPEHPASFRLWLRKRLAERVPLLAMRYLNGDAPDITAECNRYGALLDAEPIDVGFIGIGENGHIAFNDPPVADFNDPYTVKRVALDEACRRQQVGEGHFASLETAPGDALTVTCSAILGFRHVICVVPEGRKAEAIRNTLNGPISTACPASALREHPSTALYLDNESAALI